MSIFYEFISENSSSLRILEAYPQDVGRGIARIQQSQAQIMNLEPGDTIKIKGDRTTVVKYIPSHLSDEEKSVIRLDGLTRHNANLSLDDVISVQKIESIDAEQIIVSPLEVVPPVDGRYIADSLEGIPVIKDDKVMVPYFGGRLTYQIVNTVPKDCVVTVTQKTHFFVSNGKLTLLHDGDIIRIKEDMIGKIAMLEKLEKTELDKLLSDIEKNYHDIRDKQLK